MIKTSPDKGEEHRDSRQLDFWAGVANLANYFTTVSALTPR